MTKEQLDQYYYERRAKESANENPADEWIYDPLSTLFLLGFGYVDNIDTILETTENNNFPIDILNDEKLYREAIDKIFERIKEYVRKVNK